MKKLAEFIVAFLYIIFPILFIIVVGFALIFSLQGLR